MKALFVLALLGMREVAAVTHSLTYIVTTVTGMKEFPEYSEVINVDGQEFVYYNCSLRKIIPKNAWIEENFDPDFWKLETERNINNHQLIKGEIHTVMQRLNQSDGSHIYQWMYGIEMDDETNKIDGFEIHAYDGNDYLYFDLKTENFIAAAPQAVITKNNRNNKAMIDYRKNIFANFFPELLKKYVNYGRSYLMRTELPSVSLLRKTPSSPISCHATGFYPKEAELFWRKDGEEIHEYVDKGEILPNNDGTFQMSTDLRFLSDSYEEWPKYECVFHLSGVKEDMITKLDKINIRTNKGTSEFPTTVFIIIAVVVGGFVAAGAAGVIFWKRRNTGMNHLTHHQLRIPILRN
ncbi:class I histocompatibility antigen, F10 alpha chain-like isoform X2 [Leuresthes tenuis]|uniref:class I histocompatibility antigen, F10 alpha chain-like isoform X2 n=1 Tax=Leuresthes tenuis TaxID=355514 RepID=UPI003B5110F5